MAERRIKGTAGLLREAQVTWGGTYSAGGMVVRWEEQKQDVFTSRQP